MDGTGELFVDEDKQRITNLEAAVTYATRELKSLLHDRPPSRTINTVLLAVVRRLAGQRRGALAMAEPEPGEDGEGQSGQGEQVEQEQRLGGDGQALSGFGFVDAEIVFAAHGAALSGRRWR